MHPLCELLVRADTAALFAEHLDKSPVDVHVLAPPVNPGGNVVIPDVEVTNVVVPVDAVDLVGIKPVAGLDLTEHNVALLDRLWMQYRLEDAEITVANKRSQRIARRHVLHCSSFLELTHDQRFSEVP